MAVLQEVVLLCWGVKYSILEEEVSRDGEEIGIRLVLVRLG